MAADSNCAAFIESNKQQLNQLKSYVTEVSDQAKALNALLLSAEERSSQQADLIRELEARLLETTKFNESQQENIQQAFFKVVAQHLAISSIYRVETDALVIASNPVFIFGKGELGAEGISRLKPVAEALLKATAALPKALSWRLQVLGHTDNRPLRNNQHFPSNWELSAARAVAVLRFLAKQGITDKRLQASGMAATAVLNTGNGKKAHRANRRIEIKLIVE